MTTAEKLKPNALILKADGTNCEVETAEAFRLGGAKPEIVMMNQLRNKEVNIFDYEIFALPGGFAYGDDVASGAILALELERYLADQMYEFTERKNGLVIGICNGFQVLTRSGLLPFAEMGKMDASLTNNDSGHFEYRPIRLKVDDENACEFLNGVAGEMEFKVAHGEGKFYAPSDTIDKIENQKQVVFRYCDLDGNPTQEYPANPNGSLHAIAGICDPKGRILGLMPHPERSVKKTQYDNWRRMGDFKPEGLQIFEGMVNYARQS